MYVHVGTVQRLSYQKFQADFDPPSTDEKNGQQPRSLAASTATRGQAFLSLLALIAPQAWPNQSD